MTEFNDRANDNTGEVIDPDTLRLVPSNTTRIKTVDVELRERLDEVESAIADLTVEKQIVAARLQVAEAERRTLHRLVAVLDRVDAAEARNE